MKPAAVLITLAILVLEPIVSAHDGKVLYEQLCGACHGNNGRGAQDGLHPPLADSAWVKGPPDRLIQIVLHGLMGEISVPSRHSTNPTYDLVMPPHGASLSDAQIARITSHVRSSWGNSEATVTAAMVAAQRKAAAGRSDFWQAAELLRKHPLGIKALRIGEPGKPPGDKAP